MRTRRSCPIERALSHSAGHRRPRAGSQRIYPALTNISKALAADDLAPDPAAAPRQTATAPAAAAAAAAATAASRATAASGAPAAAASATSAAAASAATAATATPCEVEQGSRLLDQLFVVKVERSQGDVGDFLLTHGEGLRRSGGGRWHASNRFRRRRRRSRQG